MYIFGDKSGVLFLMALLSFVSDGTADEFDQTLCNSFQLRVEFSGNASVFGRDLVNLIPSCNYCLFL